MFINREHYTVEQHKVAGMLALGYDTKQIVLEAKVPLLTVKKLKKDPHFIILVQNLRADLYRVAIEDGRDAIARDIRKYRTEYKMTSEKLAKISNIFLEKIHQCMDLIQPEDISPSTVPAYVRATLDLIKLSEECNQRSLGLDKLLELSDEFTEIVEAHREKPYEFDDNPSSRRLEASKDDCIEAICEDDPEDLE